MNVQDILKIVEEIDGSSLAYFDYHSEDVHLTLAKEMLNSPSHFTQSASISQEVEKKEPSIEVTSHATENNAVQEETVDENIREVTAPIIGVAYLQPKPEEPPFIKVGDYVNEGDVIMILEAMKLMNEIQSTESGVVTEILVENEEVVEYGQPLIRVK
ncbi:acetyl-CoA carboxylase biotin carboxyl carrier protein [Dolosicoccus paucivorans]|uniref:Biotin carboxyl carrier protein of acetyl-CoA carboxylase n=1 Tax=Dolosicoccus paucivorans TaxID=84521 RepID=A0A1G8JTC3_9LACT|nr:acetyl-CoA carboxylase biotin carboxyl carrier protein [Dolosicoccus paucivorans]PMB83898.1 acetyl-CoA carboxylase biotin carboxyl carrier protein [Dolosicoccus paucivorans]PMC58057.1 acetyl-CoA carboxylase biotin carboxyl carrier protein [Dolosicoccus paucivorans]SDI33840.1 acetyl-CoA carboxylase biotin carboxyl carrier protein [Dolosicoccus paucivorans]